MQWLNNEERTGAYNERICCYNYTFCLLKMWVRFEAACELKGKTVVIQIFVSIYYKSIQYDIYIY